MPGKTISVPRRLHDHLLVEKKHLWAQRITRDGRRQFAVDEPPETAKVFAAIPEEQATPLVDRAVGFPFAQLWRRIRLDFDGGLDQRVRCGA